MKAFIKVLGFLIVMSVAGITAMNGTFGNNYFLIIFAYALVGLYLLLFTKINKIVLLILMSPVITGILTLLFFKYKTISVLLIITIITFALIIKFAKRKKEHINYK